MIIAIDGVAASGKSTIARLLAQRLSYFYINSGLLYRSVAFMLQTHYGSIAIDAMIHELSPEVLTFLYQKYHVQYEVVNGVPVVRMNGIEVTPTLKSASIDAVISGVAGILDVRTFVSNLQRSLASQHDNVVIEGRDIATHVFPHAECKLFITADLRVRAERWLSMQNALGFTGTIEEAVTILHARDLKDQTRKVGALVQVSDAYLIDTSSLTPDQAVEKIILIVKSI